MKKKYLLYMSDIVESINRIHTYIQGVDYDSFSSNQMLMDAVIRNLEVIGEASKNLPEEIRVQYPMAPWRKMIGLRNILIHEYFGVDSEIVWQIITVNLSETKQVIEQIIEKERL